MSQGSKPRIDLNSPSSSQSLTKSNSSQSEYPTPAKAMADMLLQSTESKSEKNANSQTERPQMRRQYGGVYSVVSDSAVLTPIHRPDAHGTVGTPIEIYTNHFPVSIDDAIINQYDIDIRMLPQGQQGYSVEKNERLEVVKILSRQEKDFPIAWYDEEERYLYTKSLLTDFIQPRLVKLVINNEEKCFQFTVLNLVRQEKIGNIFDFINGKTPIRPRDSIRIIETLFKQTVPDQYICVRNKYYDRSQTLLDLKDGSGLASGFHPAVCLTRSGPTINVNLAFTCFYQPINFVDFACRYLRQDITKGINEDELKGMQKLFFNLPIKTIHVGRPIQYRLKSFGVPANKLKFVLKCNNDSASDSLPKQITVADYFATKYKTLQYPYLPCIYARNGVGKRAHWLPMEVVQVVEWERLMRPLDSVQQALVLKESIVKPGRRYDQIMNIMHQRNFNTDPYLQTLNIQVNTQEMLKIRARILPPPQIIYRTQNNQSVVEHISLGKWKLQNQFYSTPVIKKWSIVYFGPQPDDHITGIVCKFQRWLLSILEKYGVRINPCPQRIASSSRRQSIDEVFNSIKAKGFQLAIVILNATEDTVYNYVKQLGNQRLGIITQCTNFQAIQRNSKKLKMYVKNLSQKLNAKLGGINGIANLKEALSQTSNTDRFMFFGVDVTHTTASKQWPSVAAIVGSCDPSCSRYVARLGEQYPEQGRCSIEIVKDLQNIIVDLLQVYARSCGNTLPNRIVFYRDGVDDENFQKVLDNEVNKIKSAFQVVYEENPMPLLTFIIVKKRHNTRFFAYDDRKTTNIKAGTVIDQDITHPSQFDFYLCSQTARTGTSRPALYHVLHDENGFSSDDIQQLTYWLCHTDARCSKSVSIPAPVHYAHLAAHASTAYKFNDDNDQILEGDDGEYIWEPSTLEDVKTKMMTLNANIKDTMWFV